MSYTRVMHWGRKWPRPRNHLDGRVCPECSATVHGNQAQHHHLNWHAELADRLNSMSERIGFEPEQPGVPWTAAVDEEADQEAIDERAG